jgi:hypothetical protein
MGRKACTVPQYLYKGALYLFYFLYKPKNCVFEFLGLLPLQSLILKRIVFRVQRELIL